MRSSRTTRSVTDLGYAKHLLLHAPELIAQRERDALGLLERHAHAQGAACGDLATVPGVAGDACAADRPRVRGDALDADAWARGGLRELDLQVGRAQLAQERRAQWLGAAGLARVPGQVDRDDGIRHGRAAP